MSLVWCVLTTEHPDVHCLEWQFRNQISYKTEHLCRFLLRVSNWVPYLNICWGFQDCSAENKAKLFFPICKYFPCFHLLCQQEAAVA